MIANVAPEPKHLSTESFHQYESLVATYECWAHARKDKMLPSKLDFERATLDSPEFLPNMTLVELSPDGEIQFVYVGSQIVTRRNSEQTGMVVENMFDPKAEKLIHDWALANLKVPVINCYNVRTHLPSGVIGESVNLSVVLSNGQGLPSCIAATTVVDQAYEQEVAKGGFLLGSAGLEMDPLDIGYGIPDLPRTIG